LSDRQAGTYARKTGTPAHNAAMAILSSLKVPYENEAPFPRPGKRNSRGDQLYYSVDVLCYPRGRSSVGVEVEGRGSKSRDNPEREDILSGLGVKLVHVDNGTALKAPLKLAALVAMRVLEFDTEEGDRLCREICGRLAAAKS